MASNVAAVMPPITPVPTAARAPAPAPLENANGTTPRINANEVIKMGRNRKRAASREASRALIPSSRFSTANSTIKIAFFAARPSNVTRPIWKYTSLVMSRIHTASSAPNKPNGMASSTENGRVHFSYWAARIRNTISAPKTSAKLEEPSERFS